MLLQFLIQDKVEGETQVDFNPFQKDDRIIFLEKPHRVINVKKVVTQDIHFAERIREVKVKIQVILNKCD